MISYNSFAIVGFGVLGAAIASEFTKSGTTGRYKLRVLTRESSKNKPDLTAFASKGVEIIGVDYSSPDSLKRALQGVDVVISTLRDDGLDVQTEVVRAAKAAGVKLFVPSEFAINTIGTKHEYLQVKVLTHALLKELALPYTLFFVGVWPEALFQFGPPLGIDFAKGKFDLFAEDVPVSWTSPRSIAPFVHYVLTNLPPSQLENRAFKMEGERKTWREIISVWEAKTGRKAEVTVLSDDEYHKFKAAQTSVLMTFAPTIFKEGGGVVGGDDKGVWPEWKPLTWEDILA